MRFAYLIMGDFRSDIDIVGIHGGAARIIGVSDIEEACSVARWLKEEGIDCIELCGAFERAGVEKIIAATGNELPVGYVVYLSEQGSLLNKVFGS